MSAPSRAVLRQSQFLTRRTAVRHASSSTEKATQAAAKAQEGLSKVTATAGPAISNAASALRKVGGPVGKVVSFVDFTHQESLRPSVHVKMNSEALLGYPRICRIHDPPRLFTTLRSALSSASWFSVARRCLLRINMATFQSYFQPLTNNFLARVRNASPKEIALVGVTAAEVIGFFTVGEIIGRMNLVGYRGEAASHH
ncbi:mitochondrial ATP synthase g subunit-domain-containing protein [Penicillium malachiteum]|uniref:mitochondrial ATP synthase g subunit-domain-containing protein n=1 Tax=Penicillium malachiteum TaxID=1324776 RepID=UPI002548A828|nr:mitochondrial ATP synthase g subunit-domain-containing protein [Penicillium malachiteum]KAJ5725120.1 mitochondrial ATP synthase g subunit-domain-containing protein [Penicillium malachiteum]